MVVSCWRIFSLHGHVNFRNMLKNWIRLFVCTPVFLNLSRSPGNRFPILTYRTARDIYGPLNRFLGSFNVYEFGVRFLPMYSTPPPPHPPSPMNRNVAYFFLTGTVQEEAREKESRRFPAASGLFRNVDSHQRYRFFAAGQLNTVER